MSCPVFGTPNEFDKKKQLTTYSDVMRCYNQEWQTLKETCNKDLTVGDVVVVYVAKKPVNIYDKASIPVLSWKQIMNIMHPYHAKHEKLQKQQRFTFI